ncbi:MAG: DDE-type integrase/transposase/recombinase [Nanoarchaeota archaeon]|nr:DDE-type integrase/transposase/recombinase [Nanoarchaeota archaeon]MBU2420668.1 DDE-type integrase/transposase/recombinase [Nanoarchaeota archaeon]MBU2475207.1 DDE-type integrase/transposase/recombinase [Nanoarchaeota archaeon]
MRLNPVERKLMTNSVKQGNPKKLVAQVFGVSRTTVWYWSSETLNSNFEDIPRTREGKITIDVEISILFMRTMFKWGTARIQQGLMDLPSFQREEMEVCVQNFQLSRTSINNVLKKHKLNGYQYEAKTWKFFRAKEPNELWQADLKEFIFEGKKYYIFVCIDDYSRFIICLKLFDHCPKTEELTSVLRSSKIKPKKILSDNGPQFREQWKIWWQNLGSEPIFAHPYYPQDKGKVERTIRNLAEEFVNLLSKFKHWINGKLEEWRIWFNERRFHRGIKGFPINFYVKL